MELITRESRARTVAKTYKKSFLRKHGWVIENGEQVWNDLSYLGPNPNPDDVDKILGDGLWTHILCDVCNEHKETVIKLINKNQPNDCYICDDCLIKAMDLLEWDS